MGKKNSFIFYYDWLDIIEPLSNEQKGELITAVFDYVIDGKNPEFSDLALKISFNIIRNTINRDSRKYEEMCALRSKNGKKGALKRWGKEDNMYECTEYCSE